MAQIKLTKSELKWQKDALKRYYRYLPTLMLKKQQLQVVMRQIERDRRAKLAQRDEVNLYLQGWISMFAEPVDLTQFVVINEMRTTSANIAGIEVPVFEMLTFKEPEYDLFMQPLWVDWAVEAMQKLLKFDLEVDILDKQYQLVSQELRTTSQRVNLFEKIKIPEAKEAIRRIQIYLGDEQTAAVVRGKMAKKKLGQGE
jgi:V/A-type H+-transporting ATPase subunit D